LIGSRTRAALLTGALIALSGVACAPPTNVVAPTAQPRGGRAWQDYFPNVELTTHRGDQVRFYDDLIKGKIVVINFMYATCTDS